jgi:hypothetical protein
VLLMLGRLHRGWTVPTVLRRSGHGALVGALQGLAFIALWFLSVGRLFIFRADGVVAWGLRPDCARRTRACTTCRACGTRGALTAS